MCRISHAACCGLWERRARTNRPCQGCFSSTRPSETLAAAAALRLQFWQGVLDDGHALAPAMRQHRRRLLLLGLNLWACSGVMNAASPDVGAHAELLPAEVKLMSNASSCLGAGCSDSSEGAHTRLEPASRRGADELRVFSPGARPALLVGLRPAGNSSTSDDDASQQFFQNSLAPILARSCRWGHWFPSHLCS